MLVLVLVLVSIARQQDTIVPNYRDDWHLAEHWFNDVIIDTVSTP